MQAVDNAVRYSLLDIHRWLGVFSFTVKLVSKIMRAFWVHVMHLGLILSMLLLMEASCPWWQVLPSLMTAKVEGMC
jgi:hypothetical protein